MYQVSRIDEDGYFLEPVVVEEGVVLVDEDIVAVPVPEGFHRPQWDGEAWIEGMSSEDIEERQNTPQPETDAQRISRLESELLAAQLDNLVALEAIAELYEMFILGGS